MSEKLNWWPISWVSTLDLKKFSTLKKRVTSPASQNSSSKWSYYNGSNKMWILRRGERRGTSWKFECWKGLFRIGKICFTSGTLVNFNFFVSYKTTQFDSTLILSLKALRKSRTVKLDTFRLMIINELVLFKSNQQTNAIYLRNSL